MPLQSINIISAYKGQKIKRWHNFIAYIKYQENLEVMQWLNRQNCNYSERQICNYAALSVSKASRKNFMALKIIRSKK